MTLKYIRCVSGGFPGGLLPVLPYCRQKRTERVSDVRVMTCYVKYRCVSIFYQHVAGLLLYADSVNEAPLN